MLVFCIQHDDSPRASPSEEDLAMTRDHFDLILETHLDFGLADSPVFHSSSKIIPSDRLLEDVPTFIQQELSHFLVHRQLQRLASTIISYGHRVIQSRRNTASHTTPYRLIPLIVKSLIQVRYQDEDMVDWVMQQSMEQVSMIPATDEVIGSLKKVKVVNDETDAKDCRICLESFEDEENGLEMPCGHIYHEACIVRWLKTSHMCPLCRYQMPIE